ncbi:hypothetical protein ACOI1H_09045 [Loktanella sp. DJP18]|uniref:hypothetical protein n=1 Tax=Loktanella sp. DJP18 TaxID=3409788 RepID=UPI003BB78091
MKGDALDPAGLIREAFRIDGITAADCRVIFLDWAMKRSQTGDLRARVAALCDQYADQPADHPMMQTLKAGLARSPIARRRGGRAGRAATQDDEPA